MFQQQQQQQQQQQAAASDQLTRRKEGADTEPDHQPKALHNEQFPGNGAQVCLGDATELMYICFNLYKRVLVALDTGGKYLADARELFQSPRCDLLQATPTYRIERDWRFHRRLTALLCVQLGDHQKPDREQQAAGVQPQQPKGLEDTARLPEKQRRVSTKHHSNCLLNGGICLYKFQLCGARYGLLQLLFGLYKSACDGKLSGANLCVPCQAAAFGVFRGETAQDQNQLAATLQRLAGLRGASEAADAEAARMLEEVDQNVAADKKTKTRPLQGLSAILMAS